MRTALSLCLALAAGCASPAGAGPRNAKPEWVDGKSREYPSAEYMTGVGIADDRATAEERARAEIGKVFTVRVKSTVQDTASESLATSGKKEERRFSQELSQRVESVSDKTLSDVSIEETWQDEATRRYHALAVLKRSKARKALSEQIADFDAKAQIWAKELDSSPERLARVKAAMKVSALMKARAELNTDLRIVDPSGGGIAPPFDEAQLGPKAAKAMASLDIVVDIQE